RLTQDLEKTLDALRSDDPVSRKDSLVGTVLDDQYEILSVIGQGGMSIVYKARHVLMNKIVAVKTLLPHLALHPLSMQRFILEAKAASNLTHPHVITIHHSGVTTTDQPYIVMDYLQGTSLQGLLNTYGKLPAERACHIFIQIADALALAHKHGVIHRDLKPSNILLIEQGGDADFVKVVDFGIAKLLPQEGTEAMRLTQTGEVFGSPLYMSPEQAKGEKLDAKSDIYSLGCLMYEMLCGKPALDGDNTLEVLYKHINDIPDTFSMRGVKVPNRLEMIVFKCIAKDPAQRYQSMNQLGDDLRNLEEERRTSMVKRLFDRWELFLLRRKPRTKKDRMFVLAATSALALMIGIAAFLAFLQIRALESPSYHQDFQWQEDNLPRNEMPDAEDTMEQLKLNERYTGIMTALDRTSPEAIEDVAQGLIAFGDRVERRHYFDLAVDSFKKAVSLNTAYHGADSVPTYMARAQYGDALMKRGDMQAAYNEYTNISSTIKSFINEDTYTAASMSRRVGDCLYMMGRYREAKEVYARTWDVVRDPSLLKVRKEDLNKLNPEVLASEFGICVSRLADCERRISAEYPPGSDYGISLMRDAAEHYFRAVTAWRKCRGQYNDDETVAVCRLAQAEHVLGDYKHAAMHYQEALDHVLHVFGPRHPYVGVLLRDHSQFLWDDHQYIQSIVERIKAWQSFIDAK
ncbi:MAG: protein kinase domain-containing protein, partial [Terriglobales bacterium]